MKSFLGTFGIVLLISFIFLFFGGEYIFGNFWGIFIFSVLVISILLSLIERQGAKIEELEKRIQALESQIEPKE